MLLFSIIHDRSEVTGCAEATAIADGALFQNRFVYTGSEDGRVHIYNRDGTVRQILDTQAALASLSRNQDTIDEPRPAVVREVSWHPQLPIVVGTVWGGPDGEDGCIIAHGYAEDPDAPYT